MAVVILIVFALAGVSARAAEDRSFYLVQKNDTLTTILYSLGITPLWGKHGSVKKIIAHNDFIRAREKSGNLIFPGEKILLPDDLQPKVERNITLGFVSQNDDSRVDFNCSEEGLSAWSLHLKSKNPNKDPFDPKSRTLALRCDRTHTLADQKSESESQTETTMEVADEPVKDTATVESTTTQHMEDHVSVADITPAHPETHEVVEGLSETPETSEETSNTGEVTADELPEPAAPLVETSSDHVEVMDPPDVIEVVDQEIPARSAASAAPEPEPEPEPVPESPVVEIEQTQDPHMASEAATLPVETQPETVTTHDRVTTQKRLTSRIGVLGSYSFSAHDSVDSQTGSTARLLSKPTLGYGLHWTQLWGARFESRIAFYGQRLVLRDTVRGQVQETSVEMTGFEFSGKYQFESFDLRLVFSQAEEPYVRAPAVGSAVVEGSSRTRLGLIFGKDVYEDSGLSLRVYGGSLFGFASSTSDYTVNPDRRDQVGIGITQQLDRQQIHFDLVYGQKSGTSSISTSTDRFLQGLLGIDFDLGGGSR